VPPKRNWRELNSLPAYLKALEQKEANSSRRSIQQQVIKIRADINQIETKRTIQRINKTRSWYFEKINKMNKSLARLTREHRRSIQINKIRNEKENLTMETVEIQKITRFYYKSLYSTKLKTVDEMDNFLDTYQVPKLKQDQIKHLNSPITPTDIEAVINSLPTNKKPRTRWV
jgi:predicted N-acyltransferase